MRQRFQTHSSKIDVLADGQCDSVAIIQGIGAAGED